MLRVGYRRMFSLGLTVAFALHMVVGCCIHHSHAGDDTADERATGCGSHQCGATHDWPDDTSCPSHRGEDSADCLGDTCYLLASRVIEIQPDTSILPDGCIAPPSLSYGSMRTVVCGVSLDLLHPTALPVRAHLLCGVLLL